MTTENTAHELQQQLIKARNEISNLRKQLLGLKHIHQKEVSKIKQLLTKNCECQATPKPKAVPVLCPLKNDNFPFVPIGYISTEFPQKRGTPRQPTISMPSNIVAKLTIGKETFTNPAHALEDLQLFSHMWILFVFHKNEKGGAASKVAPPRLGGERTGVFATRSPHRPNPIGLSLVKIEKIEDGTVYFTGVDMVDQTPVLDIKPYIPHYDLPRGITGPEERVRIPSWIDRPPVNQLEVSFEDVAQIELERLNLHRTAQMKEIISNVLREDPRSVYVRDKYGDSIYKWQIQELTVTCQFDNLNHRVNVIKVEPNS